MYIKIHAFPDSRDENVNKKGADSYDIRVREPAENNRANKRIIEIVHALYPDKPVRLVSGHASPHKIVSIGD